MSRFSRRELLQAGAGLALAGYGLSGCTVERPWTDRPPAGMIKPKIDGDLLIYNWAQYMDPDLQKGFSEKYGVKVTEVNYDNLEAMVIKLALGRAVRPDLAHAPSTSRASIRRGCSPTSTAACCRTTTTSRASTTPLVGPEGRPLGSLHVLHDRDRLARGRGLRDDRVVERHDEPGRRGADVHPRRLRGGDRRGEHAQRLRHQHRRTPNELEQSKNTLLEQKQNARGFSTNSVHEPGPGSAVLHQAWNGDIVNVRNQVDDPRLFKYETCAEGVPVGTDLMCIPVNARSPGTALMFMNWLLIPEHAARNVAWNGYPMPCEGGKQEFAKLVKDEPSIDVNLEDARQRRARVPPRDAAVRREWATTFTEVKAA